MDFNSIPEWLHLLLLACGIFTIAIMLAGLFNAISTGIRTLIERFRYWYERKHRFDGPPLAKCYCKDCEEWHQKEHDETEGSCWAHGGWTTADCWFCWDANPRKE